MFTRLKAAYQDYPKNFWILVGALFIDRVGGALIYPFLALYITGKFNVGMTEVGIIFAIHSGGAFFGNMAGGAFADKFGRKTMLVIGLVFSASITILMGLINEWELFYGLAFVTGLLSEFGGPAVQAMIADILPLEKRTDGFGILRVVINLSVTIGPAIGGVLAGINYLLLFITDSVISIITAIIVILALPETKPALKEGQVEETVVQSFGGYGRVLKDRVFLAFIFLSTFTMIVYMQMNSTLSVFMRDVHNIPAQYFGYLLSVNAAMVVLFQFFVTRRVKRFHPLLVMMVGNLFYAVGFGLFGFTAFYWQFILAMVILTIGEMINAPVMQTLVASIAPDHMRGRYMAVFHTGWGIAAAIGPLAAGVILDNYDPNWIWYAGGIICSVVALGYIVLKGRVGHRFVSLSERDKENMA
jgi:MFS family permease